MRISGRIALAALVVTIGLAAAARSAAPPAAVPDGLRLVNEYNQRNFGSPGWRRVYLELKSGAKVTRTFTILHLWRTVGDEVPSLVVLEQPAGLRGTSYLLVEDPQAPAEMRLALRLPAGERRVLTITPGRFEEGLLGSDFAYSDLRWRLPTTGFRLTVAGKSRLLGREVWMVDAEPSTPQAAQSTSWARVRYYLSREPAILLGADFHRNPAGAPFKQLRVESTTRVGQAWTQTRMVMSLAGGRSSVLTLKDVGPLPESIGTDLFVPEMLGTVAERANGWVADRLLRREGP